MKIAIIGAGNVGTALGAGWVKAGHDVVLGVREPTSEKTLEAVRKVGGNCSAAAINEAANQCEIVALVTPWTAVSDAIAACGDLSGKILIDCTNPIGPGLTLSVGHVNSGAEIVAGLASGARVVKGFSTTGWENISNSQYGSAKITTFICGDSEEAKQKVSGLADDLGIEAFDVGALNTARYIEPLAMTWILPARAGNLGPDFALAIVRR